MSEYVIIVQENGGVITHRNVDSSKINLPDHAEVFQTEEDFKNALEEA